MLIRCLTGYLGFFLAFYVMALAIGHVRDANCSVLNKFYPSNSDLCSTLTHDYNFVVRTMHHITHPLAFVHNRVITPITSLSMSKCPWWNNPTHAPSFDQHDNDNDYMMDDDTSL